MLKYYLVKIKMSKIMLLFLLKYLKFKYIFKEDDKDNQSENHCCDFSKFLA